MPYLIIILVILSLAALSTVFYRVVNKGLSSSSRHQQLTRLSVASLIAMAPWLIAGRLPSAAPEWGMAGVCILWCITYPLLYHLSNRRTSSEYDNQMDIALGLYAFGLMSAIQLALGEVPAVAAVTTGAIETAMLALILAQWVYYLLYKSAVDFNGMMIVQATNINEVFEFARSFNPVGASLVILCLIATVVAPVTFNLICTPGEMYLSGWVMIAEGVVAIALACFIFAGRKAPARRCGLVNLYCVILDYRRRNSRYAASAAKRIANLEVTPAVSDEPSPRTVIMVIGESANRDYMSAFRQLDRETTPWLSELKQTDNAILFPNAYSCAMVTVNSLERALTERNQYNDKDFQDSVSIVDIARKLGYKIHWYSNQGHLGAFDTPVTLVADTADVARWTDQQLNKVPYDEALLDFLDEIDSSRSNFVVIHLKGNHFNFANRYPASHTVWTPRDGENANVVNYLNSIRYTDYILRRIFEYGRDRLNLDAMVYFSDHATIPDRMRTPGFLGFGMTRIPLAVWLSDGYRERHPERDKALRANASRYFTNDLAYELMCGIFDISSNHYDETNSLASDKYKYTRDMLTTYDGTVRIADDTTDDGKEA
ncbi:MAG: phosphoethanolamine transferase [Muribaculaceae bacterium]|nr:phosphoethanolamine transferase [Muribaculaceae bacterium]